VRHAENACSDRYSENEKASHQHRVWIVRIKGWMAKNSEWRNVKAHNKVTALHRPTALESEMNASLGIQKARTKNQYETAPIMDARQNPMN
jgi:hypothetical protein